jgi:hypothetical protein
VNDQKIEQEVQPNYCSPVSPRFNDWRNIQINTTRVIWAPAVGPHFEGWVLPGGQRIQDYGRAMGCATQMESLVHDVSKNHLRA